jgi:MurNAc alpha-1-phosphate uridylyltransferase
MKFTVTDEAHMATIGTELATLLPHGAVVFLSGDLGMGKTTLARAIIRARLNRADETIPSPTFTLQTRYNAPEGDILHYDFYRLKNSDECAELGLDEINQADLALIEWPEHMGPWQHRVGATHSFTIKPDGTGRLITLTRPDIACPLDTALVFAAGLGTRMAALTADCPKPLVLVNNRPILAYILDQLLAAGIQRVFLNTHYMLEKIERFLDPYRNQCTITTNHEPVLLETGGGMLAVLPQIDRPVFWALNGDALQTEGPGLPHLLRLAVGYQPTLMDILLLTARLDQPTITPGLGDYFVHNNGRLEESKTKQGTHFFAGPRLLNRSILDGRAPGKFSFKQQMDAAEAVDRLYGLEHTGMYHHLSTPEDVRDVTAFLQGRLEPTIMKRPSAGAA